MVHCYDEKAKRVWIIWGVHNEVEKAFRCVDIDEIINVLGDEGELSDDSEANENVDEVYLQPSIP